MPGHKQVKDLGQEKKAGPHPPFFLRVFHAIKQMPTLQVNFARTHNNPGYRCRFVPLQNFIQDIGSSAPTTPSRSPGNTVGPRFCQGAVQRPVQRPGG